MIRYRARVTDLSFRLFIRRDKKEKLEDESEEDEY